MNRIFKISTSILGLVTSLTVMISFQNCGKITLADAVNSASSAKLAAGTAVPTPDSLIIDIKDPTSPLMRSEAGPMVNGPGLAKSDVNPVIKNDAVAGGNPQASIQNPKSAGDVETIPAGSLVKHCNLEKDEEDDDTDSAFEAKELKKKVAHCGDFEIEDILLNIQSASSNDLVGSKSEAGLEIIDTDKTISLNKSKLKLKAHHSGNLKSLFLGLNQNGNKVLNKKSQIVNLKTAAIKNAGLNVKLDIETEIKEGHEYSLELTIEQEDQVVENPAQCLFKPIIKVAVLIED